MSFGFLAGVQQILRDIRSMQRAFFIKAHPQRIQQVNLRIFIKLDCGRYRRAKLVIRDGRRKAFSELLRDLAWALHASCRAEDCAGHEANMLGIADGNSEDALAPCCCPGQRKTDVY